MQAVPSPVSKLSHFKPIHAIPSIFLKVTLILFCHLRLKCPFLRVFPQNTKFLFWPIRAMCPAHLILLHLTDLKSGARQRNLFAVRPKHLPRCPILEHPQTQTPSSVPYSRTLSDPNTFLCALFSNTLRPKHLPLCPILEHPQPVFVP